MTGSRPQQLHWLTVLRYPAALWVILFHCLSKSITASDSSVVLPTAFRSFVDRGFLGVSFFFMLSGFILAWNYPEISDSKDYLRARMARVLPNYYLALFFAFPLFLGRMLHEGLYLMLIPKLMMIITLTQSWIPSVSTLWNGPSWTLSCEAFFYVSLIFMLPKITKQYDSCPSSRLGLTLGLLWLIGLIAPLIYIWKFGAYMDAVVINGTLVPKNQTIAKFWVERFPLLRVIEFTAGVLLCVGLRATVLRIKPIHAIALIIGGTCWIATTLLLPFIISMGTWCLPGFACVILGAAALPCPPESRIFCFAQLLGNSSYAVYLFHIPVRDYLVIFYKHFFNIRTLSGIEVFFGMSFLVTLLTTALSLIIFTYYEEPMRFWLKTRLARQSSAEADSLHTASNFKTFSN